MKIEPRNKPGEPEANPALWNNLYACWHDELDHKIWIDRVIRTTVIAIICLVGLVCLVPGLTTLARKSQARRAKHRMIRTVDLTGNSESSSFNDEICVTDGR